MTYGPAVLAEELQRLRATAGRPTRLVVAFSGGMDSTVLAHSISILSNESDCLQGIPLLALYVDHGMQTQSADWGEQCGAIAREFGIDFRIVKIDVQRDSGKGLEAAARDARYRALQNELQTDDWLLSAHHRNDQAETLLLNLIRGSGPRGVAGIAAARRLGGGWLMRPLLHVDRDALLQYAKNENLNWIEDPSNQDEQFDRNFLRIEIMPRLRSRWADISRRLNRSALHASEASELLTDLAKIDLQHVGGYSARLSIGALLELPQHRQRNLIRYALRDRELSTPTSVQLNRILNEVIPAKVDAQPLVSWQGGSVRRYRDGLYLLEESLADAVVPTVVGNSVTSLGRGLGAIRLEENAGLGLNPDLVRAGLRLEPRRGGEEIQLHGQTHTRKLKNLLQEASIVPWMRDRLPLVYSGDHLVAVADLWLSADAAAAPGVALSWINRPALH